MSKRFICTVGTSIAGGNYEGLSNRPISEEGGQAAKKALDEMKRTVISHKNQPAQQKELSAELKSLLTFGIQADDLVYLLYSDTLLGKLCALAIQSALREYCGLNENAIIVEHISGLNIQNFAQFRQDGVRNLFRAAIKIFEEAGLTVDNPDHRHTAEIILNPTGGYKATVPYLTLLGSMYGKEVIYISEESDELIKLPPLPLSYDVNLMRQARPLLERLAVDDGNETIEENKLSKAEREALNGLGDFQDVLVSQVAGMLTFTPLGYLFYRRYNQEFPAGLEECQTAPADKKIHFREDYGTDILQRLAKKLVTSPYVCAVINSLPFNSRETKRIRPNQSFENGQVEIVLVKTDAGIGMLLQTSGRNVAETSRIADLLAEKFDW